MKRQIGYSNTNNDNSDIILPSFEQYEYDKEKPGVYIKNIMIMKKEIIKILKYFLMWLILLPTMVVIVFGPAVLGLYCNKLWPLLLYFPIFATILALKQDDI